MKFFRVVEKWDIKDLYYVEAKDREDAMKKHKNGESCFCEGLGGKADVDIWDEENDPDYLTQDYLESEYDAAKKGGGVGTPMRELLEESVTND